MSETKSKKEYIKECFDLLFVFIKIGFLAFGGGLAILKVLDDELVRKRKYLTSDELFDYYILSQLIPGIIIVSSCSFIGYKLKKQFGIFIALIGVLIPSITVISIIAMCMQNLISYPIVNSILRGMNVAVAAILIDINIDLMKNNINNIVYFIIFALSFISMRFFNISIIYIVIASIIIAIFYKEKNMRDEILKMKEEKDNKEKIDDNEDDNESNKKVGDK